MQEAANIRKNTVEVGGDCRLLCPHVAHHLAWSGAEIDTTMFFSSGKGDLNYRIQDEAAFFLYECIPSLFGRAGFYSLSRTSAMLLVS